MVKSRLRLLQLSLATMLGLTPQGFFIPYRYAGEIAPPGERSAYGAIESLFDEAAAGFKHRLDGLGDYFEALHGIGDDRPPDPRWNQDWFPRLDAAMAYTMVRKNRPRHMVEVGSGHSTRFLARALSDGALTTRFTAIDPSPRAVIAGLPIQIIRKTVQQAGLSPFQELAAGDILFIDSSHILMPGTDVDFLMNRVMPALPSGVLVHIHDIFLPDDYPAHWDWRGYNEQLAVATLLSGGGYRPLFASRYAVTRLAEAVANSAVGDLPLMDGALESSLWLEKL